MLPSGIPATWEVRGAGGGGALFAPQINPANPAEEFIASDMSQVFHTADAGASWQQIDFRQIQGSHESSVQYTEVPGLVYSLDYTNDLTVPTTSTDGGLTWHPLANDPTGGGAFKLFAHPGNHNVLLLSDYTRLYTSLDGGATWGLRYTTSHSGAGLHLAGAFFDGSNVYLGTSDGLLVSSNGGATFALSPAGGIASGQVILAFAGSKQGAITRFVAVTRAAADVYAGIQGYDYAYPDSVYTLDLGQPSWSLAMTGIATPAYLNYAGMAAGNVNVAYLAGGSTAGVPTVYKTTDGGGHWTSVFLTSNNQNIATGWSGQAGDRQWSYGEVALGLAVAANDPNHLVFTDLGFTHESTDGGATWHALYVKPADLNPAGSATPKGRSYHDSGLDNTTSWDINWVDASRMIVGNSDVISEVSTDGGQTFGFGFTGNSYNSTYRTVTQPATGVVFAATSSVHDLYQSTYLTDARIDGGNGAVLFSTNKGSTWQTMHNFAHPVVWVATDPTNANRLYASVVHSTAGGIYVTNDAQDGASSVWTKLTAPPRTQGHPFDIRVLNDGTLVVSFSGRRAGSPLNFTASSGVFLSSDGGATWSDRSDAAMKYWTADVVIDPGDATQSTWYAGVYNGWGGLANDLGGLYRTTDRGQHWTLVRAFNGVTSVTFNPANPYEMFVATEDQGLWYANALSANPAGLVQVASYPFRQPERVFFNPFNPDQIWVTSFGGGLFVGDTTPVTAGSIQFGNATYAVREDAGTATVTVTRAGGGTGAVSVHYATSDGTAKAGTDYTATSGTLDFADGQTSATFAIPILNDLLPDGGETVNLSLSAPTGGATLGTPATAVLTIADVPGSLRFSAPTYTVREDAGTATVTVTRALGNGGAVSVHYATSDGTAKAGTDYTAAQGDLAFADGQTTATFTVAILKDSSLDGAETVNLSLTVPGGGASLGAPSTAVLTITDVAGSLQFSAATYSVREDAGTATVTVTRALGNGGAVSVHYATSDGTAKAGTDYTAASGTLNFADGQATSTFTIPILNDLTIEPKETVNLTLGAPGGGASLGAPASAVLTINDAPGVLKFGATTYSVREDGKVATIGVVRVSGAGGAVSVHYAASNGTAKAGTDYTATQGDLAFADGQTTSSFTIPILGDRTPDGAETVNLTLSAPAGGATVGTPSTAVLTITDTPRAADDFDPDGRTDPGVFRLATSDWTIVRSAGGPLTPAPRFGAPNLADIPVVGDFDGIGKAEVGVFRPSTGEWLVLGPTGAHSLGKFGATNLTDIPVPGDYDGVGHTQLAVYRPSTSEWFVMGASGGRLIGKLGARNLVDIPVPGDYDGVGHTQLAVYRPSTSEWFVMGATGGRLLGKYGAPNLTDLPVPGDYDGVGRTELAVFRRSTAQWFVLGPTGGRLLTTLGSTNLSTVPIEAPVGALKKLGLWGGTGSPLVRSASVAGAPATEARLAAVAGPVAIGLPVEWITPGAARRKPNR